MSVIGKLFEVLASVFIWSIIATTAFGIIVASAIGFTLWKIMSKCIQLYNLNYKQ